MTKYGAAGTCANEANQLHLPGSLVIEIINDGRRFQWETSPYNCTHGPLLLCHI